MDGAVYSPTRDASGEVPAPPVAELTQEELTAELVKDLFGKISTLLEGELQKGGEDFTLLEQMNLVTTAKYREMAQYASGLVAILDKLREKRAEIQPSLDAIDRVDESVAQLEQIAMHLDEYTKMLEEKLMGGGRR